ncbi:MAG: VOC family protein [Candidatus Thorarchaeota archaeon]
MGLEKTRSDIKSSDLMEKFFGVKTDVHTILYGNNNVEFEVFITEKKEKAKDTFTHPCIAVNNRDGFLNKAISLGLPTIKVYRKESNSYYLFVKDLFGNLFEIKEL